MVDLVYPRLERYVSIRCSVLAMISLAELASTTVELQEAAKMLFSASLARRSEAEIEELCSDWQSLCKCTIASGFVWCLETRRLTRRRKCEQYRSTSRQ